MGRIDDTLARAVVVKNTEKRYGIAATFRLTGERNACVKRNIASKLA